MSQRKYARELIFEYGLRKAKPVGTPLEKNQKLTYVPYDECAKSTNTTKYDNILRGPGKTT